MTVVIDEKAMAEMEKQEDELREQLESVEFIDEEGNVLPITPLNETTRMTDAEAEEDTGE